MGRTAERALVLVGSSAIVLASLFAMTLASRDALAVSALPGDSTLLGTVIAVERDVRSTGLRVSAGPGTTFCAPVVEADIDGTSVTITSERATSIDFCDAVGDPVTVAYDAGAPATTARVVAPDVAREHWTVVGLAAIGVVAGVFGLWIVRARPHWLDIGARR